MKSLIIASLIFVSSFAFAKDYQVTGIVVDITANTIIVDKKGEKFEMALPAGIKTTGGEIKKGSKVTVYYKMTASEVEVKADKAEAKPKAKKK